MRRPALAFLHRSISSALIISVPPWPVLGSVQDTPWRARSKAKGWHLPIQISLALLTPVKCKILSLPCEQRDALTTAQWQERCFTLRLFRGEPLCLMERDGAQHVLMPAVVPPKAARAGEEHLRERKGCALPPPPPELSFLKEPPHGCTHFLRALGGTALLSQ